MDNIIQPNETLALVQACRYVAKHYEGDVGVTLFDWYDAINKQFFNGTLPQAFILTALTAYGSCIGLTRHPPGATTFPIILIHPTLKTERERFYTLLHEAIHVNVRYNLCRGQVTASGKTSHEIPEWIAEVNRIAALLGYRDIAIGYNKVSRAKKEDGGGLKRVSTGTVSYECSYRFPHALEKETGQQLPAIEQWLK